MTTRTDKKPHQMMIQPTVDCNDESVTEVIRVYIIEKVYMVVPISLSPPI
jgi:hypothetical protein